MPSPLLRFSPPYNSTTKPYLEPLGRPFADFGAQCTTKGRHLAAQKGPEKPRGTASLVPCLLPLPAQSALHAFAGRPPSPPPTIEEPSAAADVRKSVLKAGRSLSARRAAKDTLSPPPRPLRFLIRFSEGVTPTTPYAFPLCIPKPPWTANKPTNRFSAGGGLGNAPVCMPIAPPSTPGRLEKQFGMCCFFLFCAGAPPSSCPSAAKEALSTCQDTDWIRY